MADTEQVISTSIAQVIHMRAKNDVNGNPRRIYFVIVTGKRPVAIDEGYQGDAAFLVYYPHALIVADVTIPVADYYRMLKFYAPKEPR